MSLPAMDQFDNEVTFMYKQVLLKGVPYRYLLVTSGENDFRKWQVSTIINFVQEQTSLLDAWSNFSKIQGEYFSPREFLAMWLVLKQENLNDADIEAYLVTTDIERSGLDQIQDRWVKQIEKEYKNDAQIANNLIIGQKTLVNLESLPMSSLQVQNSICTMEIPIDNNYLPDYFNQAKLNYICPYIGYNSQRGQDKWYKIFHETTHILEPHQVSEKNTIYALLWSGSEVEKLEDALEIARTDLNSFQTVTLKYTEGVLSIRFLADFTGYRAGIDSIWNRLRLIFPRLPEIIPSVRQSKVSASFMIYDITLYEQIFMRQVLLNPLVQNYLYVEEKNKAQANKETLTINYRGKESKGRAPLVANIIQEKIPAGQMYLVENQETRNEFETPALRVQITSANSVTIVQSFQEIFSRLMRYYLINYENISRDILAFVPGYQEVMAARKFVVSQSLDISDEIPATLDENGEPFIMDDFSYNRRLRTFAGEMYIPSAARRCQKKFQPLLIREDEVDGWQAIIPEGTNENHRQYIRMGNHDKNKIWYFICPNDKYPYPGAKKNTLSNRNEYKFIICCYITNHLKNPNSVLSRILEGKPIDDENIATKEQKSYIYTTKKIQKPEGLGNIPTILSDFLFSISGKKFLRYGVPHTPDSFLHAVVEAILPADYAQIRNAGVDARKEYVRDLRVKLMNMNPLIARQEHAKIPLDENSYMDPSVYIELVEKYFDIRVFIFNRDPINPKTDQIQYSLEVPKYRYFRVDAPPASLDRCVFVLKNWGSDTDGLEYPQTELLITIEQEKIFGATVGKYVQDAYNYMARVLTWEGIKSFILRENEFDQVNYRQLFGENLIAQALDSAGKVQMLQVKLSDNQILSVGVQPTQPLDLPLIRNVTRVPIQTAIRTFGTPSGVSVDRDNNIEAVWFAIGDKKYALNVFTIITPNQNYPLIPPEVILFTLPGNSQASESQLNRYRRLEKASKFIVQTVKYLYLVDGQPDEIKRWLGKFTFSVKLGETSYNPLGFPRLLPAAKSSREVLQFLSDSNVTYFRNGKLQLESLNMFNSLVYTLNNFREQIAGMDAKVFQDNLREMNDYYSTINDFEQTGDIILLNNRELEKWSAENVPNSSPIQRALQKVVKETNFKIDPNAFVLQEPYFYQESASTLIRSSLNPEQDKFYLIQNVAGGTRGMERALEVAKVWAAEKRNLGFHVGFNVVLAQNLPVHKVYNVSPAGQLQLLNDYSAKNMKYLEILSYPEGNGFAALLPLN